MTCPDAIACRLTDAQCALLRLVCQGYTYSEIAEVLHVHRQTVAYRVRRICETTGARNRAEAIWMAMGQIQGGANTIDGFDKSIRL